MAVWRVILALSTALLPTSGVVGVDASGFDRSHASKHYTKRAELTIQQLKVTLLVGVLLGDMDRTGKLDYRLEVVSVDSLSDVDDGFWNVEYLDDGPTETLDEESVEEFAARSRAILETQTLDESATRTKIITPFISLLGWRVYHPEVALEYTSEALGKKDRADYVLLDENSNPAVVVEAKQEGSYLSGHEGQLKRYVGTSARSWVFSQMASRSSSSAATSVRHTRRN